MTLSTKLSLPEGCLLDPEPILETELKRSNCLWLQADKQWIDVTKDTGAAHQWRPRVGSAVASACEANEGNTFLESHGRTTGLRFTEGTHCSFVVENITKDASSFSMGTILVPSQHAHPKTVLSLTEGDGTGEDDTYIYVNLVGEHLLLSDKTQEVVAELKCTLKPEVPVLLLASVDANRMSVYLSGQGQCSIDKMVPSLKKPTSLFIGCRNNSPRMFRALGHSLVTDVFFWPDHRLLQPKIAEDTLQMDAVTNYFNWSF